MKKVYIIILVLMMCAISAQATDIKDIEPKGGLYEFQHSAEKRFSVRKERNIYTYFGQSRPLPGTPREAIEGMLRKYHKMFKISPDLSELKLIKTEGSRRHGTTLIYQQYYKGLKVDGHKITVEMDDTNRVYLIISVILPLEDFNTVPEITVDQLQDVLLTKYPQYEHITTEPELIIVKDAFKLPEPILCYTFRTINVNDRRG